MPVPYKCKIGKLGKCKRQAAETCWNCPDRVVLKKEGSGFELSLNVWVLLKLLREKGEVVKTQTLARSLGWSGALVGRLMAKLSTMGFTTYDGPRRWKVDKGKVERLDKVACIRKCEDCNTAHVELMDGLVLWRVGMKYMLKMKEWPEIDFGLTRLLGLVM